MRERPAHVPILIVGSGFSGLGLSIRLARTGRRDSLVIERASDVGGTWRDNTYPGATCDVPSHLYSFSFAPNPNWSKSFSSQWEIQVYLRQLARECAPLDRYLFDCELLAASWEAAAGAWTVETSRGTFTATILVTAFGGLCEPKLADVPGIDCFGGELFHSARWNHDYDLTSRRV